jgi:pimeloyl-ACP methyl ester carboxylesterase
MLDERSDHRAGYAEIADVPLHYVGAGDLPPIVLLHGFPDFWCRAETTLSCRCPRTRSTSNGGHHD